MKRLSLILLAIVCALCCAFTFVACNDEDTDSTTPTSEVTADQWKNALSKETSLTIKMKDGEDIITIKVDGEKVLLDSYGTVQIVSKEGDKYYMYISSDGSSWSKSDSSAAFYESIAGIYKHFLSLFKNDYNSFTYKDGVYTCAFLDKTETEYENVTVGVCKNIVITFSNDKVVNSKFDVEGGYPVEITDIGTTTINLPTVDSTLQE